MLEAIKDQRIRDELIALEEQEKHFLHQKSRVQWYVQGDRSTKYFHAITNKIRSQNRIDGVFDSKGDWVKDERVISHIFQEHFKSISNEPSGMQINQILVELDKLRIPRLFNDNFDTLFKPFSKEEISKAMFQIDPWKAPGIDGKPAIFYQKMWHIIRDVVTKASMNFLNSGFLLK